MLPHHTLIAAGPQFVSWRGCALPQIHIICDECNILLIFITVQNRLQNIYHVLVLHFFDPGAAPFASVAALLASHCVFSCSHFAPCDL